MAARRGKFSGLEIELASSILYYDKDEMLRFFDIYDHISSDANIAIDGVFDTFVSYLKKFNRFDDNVQIRKNNLIEDIKIRNNQAANKNQREVFELWFSKVLETETPMELAEDILDHFLWEEFKQAIDEIDKSDLSFRDKLAVRPKTPKSFNQDGIIRLDEIDQDEGNAQNIYTSGLDNLDSIIEFSPTNFVVIAARPGVGKSLFMLQMAVENAKRGVKTLFLSLEMNKKQIDQRIINYHIGDNLRNRYKDYNGELDAETYIKAVNEVKSSSHFKGIIDNLHLYVSKASSADTILTKIEDQIKEGGYEAIFIDYLQLLKYNRLDEWASLRTLTNALKNLAFRTNTLIVTGSQVSRTSTERGLYLSDLFGSSSIEADTDIVIGLENSENRRQGEKAMINIKVLKNREGDLAEIKYVVDYSTGRMEVANN